MLYVKNVPSVERTIRVLAGLVLVAVGVVGYKATPIGYILDAVGVVAVETGFVGFCPMCALAGRRIQKNVEAQQENKRP